MEAVSVLGRRGGLALAVLWLLAVAAGVAACGDGAAAGGEVRRDQLIMATTTSLQDSGLIDEVVLPLFERADPEVTVKVLAVGSGEAIALAESGEADVLLVHSPDDEAEFMAGGGGTLRLPVAYNHFAIVGPRSDPARVSDASDAAAAFAAIAESRQAFASRGDESGTNKKELALWADAGVTPAGGWYMSTGQGMGETLRIASEKGAYTLTDLATFLSLQDTLDLMPLSVESADLKNVYSVIIVDQNAHPVVNAAAAEEMAQVLVSAEGQEAIGAYGVARYGRRLFTPFASALGSDGY